MEYRRSREGHGGKSARGGTSRSSLKLEKIIIRIEKQRCSSMFRMDTFHSMTTCKTFSSTLPGDGTSVSLVHRMMTFHRPAKHATCPK